MRPLTCPRCNGRGKTVTIHEREHIYMSWYTWRACPACEGTGYQLRKLDAPAQTPAPIAEPLVSFAACLGIRSPGVPAAPKPLLATRIKL